MQMLHRLTSPLLRVEIDAVSARNTRVIKQRNDSWQPGQCLGVLRMQLIFFKCQIEQPLDIPSQTVVYVFFERERFTVRLRAQCDQPARTRKVAHPCKGTVLLSVEEITG